MSLCVVAGVVFCAAPGYGALSYDISLGAGVERNDNVYLAPDPPPEGETGPLRSTIATYAPGVTLSWAEQRDSLHLAYQGAYQVFQGEGEIPADWIHSLSADLTWRRWNPFFLEVRDQRDRAPQYESNRDVDPLNRVDRNTLTVRSGLSWDLGPTGSIEVAFRGEQQTYPQETEADEMTGLSGEARAQRRWNPLWSSTITLGYGDVKHTLTDDYTEIRSALEVRQRFNPRLEAVYSLEWRRDKYSRDAQTAADAGETVNEADTSAYLLKGLALNGGLEHGGSWRLSYEDRRETLTTGETLQAGRAAGETEFRARLGSNLRLGMTYEDRDFQETDRQEREWGPTVQARWIMSAWLALDLRASWTKTKVREVDTEEIVDELAGAAGGFVVLLGRHLQFEAGYRYLRNDSTEADRAYSSNRFYALVTAYLKPFVPGRFPDSVAGRFAPFLPEREDQVSTAGVVQ